MLLKSLIGAERKIMSFDFMLPKYLKLGSLGNNFLDYLLLTSRIQRVVADKEQVQISKNLLSHF